MIGLSNDHCSWQFPAMRILVAEDDARLRRHLVAALREGGHEVDATGDGLQALHLLNTGPHDAAVLDITMPGMDGVSVVREARANTVAARRCCSPPRAARFATRSPGSMPARMIISSSPIPPRNCSRACGPPGAG